MSKPDKRAIALDFRLAQHVRAMPLDDRLDPEEALRALLKVDPDSAPVEKTRPGSGSKPPPPEKGSSTT